MHAYIYVYQKCLYVTYVGWGFSWREGGRRGSLKFQWSLICKQFAPAAINFTQEISRCLVYAYTWGTFLRKWSLMAALKWIRSRILMQGICIPTLCESSWMCLLLLHCPQFFENRWISFPLMSYNNSLLNFLASISWLYLFYRGSSLIEFTIHITVCLKSESLNYWRHEFMLWDIQHPNLLSLIWKDGQMSIIILYVGN